VCGKEKASKRSCEVTERKGKKKTTTDMLSVMCGGLWEKKKNDHRLAISARGKGRLQKRRRKKRENSSEKRQWAKGEEKSV